MFNIYKQIIFCFYLIIYIKANTTSAPPGHPVSGSGIHEHHHQQRGTSSGCQQNTPPPAPPRHPGRRSGIDEHQQTTTSSAGTSSGCQQSTTPPATDGGQQLGTLGGVLGDDLSQRDTLGTSSRASRTNPGGPAAYLQQNGGKGEGVSHH